MFEDDDDDDFKSIHDVKLNEKLYAHLTVERSEIDDSPLPFYLQNIFQSKRKRKRIDYGNKERGSWDTQFEFLLSCIGYAVGLGNLWRFPAKVYEGGGGAFLIPYITFCVLFAGPMMILEMSLGQFCGLGCTRVFEICPLLSGIGWTIVITSFIVTINYTIVIARSLFYMLSSFRFILPWSVCTNPYNTPLCINTTMNVNFTNASFHDSSATQFWYLYVTGEERRNGSFVKITDSLGSPNWYCMMCVAAILTISCLTTMFGVHVTGKIIYLTVIFPIVGLMQFIVLGCTLPGALKGIKFYLYPDSSKLIKPHTYVLALEQLLFSCGIATGGVITISSFNRFRDKIYRNVMIVVFFDVFTSFLSGFASFPILGYMSYRSGREIPDLISSGSYLFFITYPEALGTLSNSNVWCALFMFMSVTLGMNSLLVLLETSTMAFFDLSTVLYTKKHKTFVSVVVYLVIFYFTTIFISPGGRNWLYIFDVKMSSFILILNLIFEIIIICYVYGIYNFQRDMELMSGSALAPFWLFTVCFIVPAGALGLLYVVITDDVKMIRYGTEFPPWATSGAWICNLLILSPVYIGALIILVKYRINNPDLSCLNWLKLCIEPPITWGPKSKLYWVQSSFYSEKMLKYKDNPLFISSFTKEDHLEKLILLAEKQLEEASLEN